MAGGIIKLADFRMAEKDLSRLHFLAEEIFKGIEARTGLDNSPADTLLSSPSLPLAEGEDS